MMSRSPHVIDRLSHDDYNVQTNVPDYEKLLEDQGLSGHRITPPPDSRRYYSSSSRMNNYVTPKLTNLKTFSDATKSSGVNNTDDTFVGSGRLNSTDNNHSPVSVIQPITPSCVASSSADRFASVVHNDLSAGRVYFPSRYGQISSERRERYLPQASSLHNLTEHDLSVGHLSDTEDQAFNSPYEKSSLGLLKSGSSNYASSGLRDAYHDPMQTAQHRYERNYYSGNVDGGRVYSENAAMDSASPELHSLRASRSRPMSYHDNLSQNLATTRTPSTATRKGNLRKMQPYSHSSGDLRLLNLVNVEIEQGSADVGYDEHPVPLSSVYLPLAGDLTRWQNKHHHQLITQQAQTEVLAGGGSSLTTSGFDQRAREPIKHAADKIIREKDQMIDKLQMKIIQMEEDSHDYGRTVQALSRHSSDTVVTMRLQDLESPNSPLKSRMAELMSTKNAKIDDLEVKLGAAELEMNRLKAGFGETSKKHSSQNSDLIHKLTDSETEVSEWRKRFTDLRAEHDDMQQKIQSLERYLDDLPTIEESTKLSQELKSLHEDNMQHKSRVVELEAKVLKAKKIIAAKDMKTKDVEKDREDLRKQVEQFRLLQDESQLRKTFEELSTLKEEKERLAIDLQKAKKIIEAGQRRLQESESRHHGNHQELVERLEREEEMVTAMQRQMEEKEEQVAKLRNTVKDISSQKQELQEQNMILQEHTAQYESHASADTQVLEHRLFREMCVCFHDLQGLVQLCKEQAEGNDPNMSVLLGVRNCPSPSSDEDASSQSDDASAVQRRLDKIRQLHKDLDKLRAIISDKFAEEMGSKLTCAQQ